MRPVVIFPHFPQAKTEGQRVKQPIEVCKTNKYKTEGLHIMITVQSRRLMHGAHSRMLDNTEF